MKVIPKLYLHNYIYIALKMLVSSANIKNMLIFEQ